MGQMDRGNFKNLTDDRIKRLSTIPPWLYDFLAQVVKPGAVRLVDWIDEMKRANGYIDQPEQIGYNGKR